VSPHTTISNALPKILILAALLLCSHISFAQSKQDSITHHYDSLAKIKLQQLDSSNNRANNKIDSVQLRLNNILNPNLKNLSSTFRKKKLELNDTIHAKHDLDSIKLGINHKIDSLTKLNLATDRYTRKLDSLNNNISPQKYIDIANSRMQGVENKINKPVNNIESKINKPIDNIESKINKPLDVMRKEGGAGANIPGGIDNNLSLNKTGIPNTDINNPVNTSIDKPSIDNPLANIQKPSIENPLDKVKSIDELKTSQEKLGEVNQVTDKVQSYSGDVKNLAKGNLDDTKNIEKTIESKAGNLGEVKDLQKQTGELDKAKGMIGKGNDPEALKTQAKDIVTKQAVDHFKGQEQALKGAMDKLTSIKQKYSNVASIKDLPKRVPNPMKDKPLIERIVPGVTLQIMNSRHFMIDINPVVSYRFTGRINAGLGWNERVSFAKWNRLAASDRIYGPRVFGSYGFRKGFSVKAEIEKMNALIPNSPSSIDGKREWVWSAFVGIKKDYKFMGTVRGNAQILYNMYDDHDNSPYFDRLVVRMGFEFPMKKHKKPQNQADK
jgi:hypothetical protein